MCGATSYPRTNLLSLKQAKQGGSPLSSGWGTAAGAQSGLLNTPGHAAGPGLGGLFFEAFRGSPRN